METAIAAENHATNAANWSLALGVLILLPGIVALFVPTLTALAVNCAYVGISMISGGVGRIMMSFAIRNAAAAQASK